MNKERVIAFHRDQVERAVREAFDNGVSVGEIRGSVENVLEEYEDEPPVYCGECGVTHTGLCEPEDLED